MAASRERRNNAGNRMTQLLNAEDEDDFYKNTYGGFNEEEGDEEYKSEEEESDEVDTDFSIDEDDEPVSDQEDDEPKKKRMRGFVSKAYKEPKKTTHRESREFKMKPEKKDYQMDSSFERKSIRKSTKEKSEATERRQREREELQLRNRKRIFTEYHRYTQEELLLEAKLTEKKNLKSLESYQRLELERKKSRIIKQSYKGPIIRYHSVSMPLIEELPAEAEKINVVDDRDPSLETQETEKSPGNSGKERCSRNFITFTDERTFREYFSNSKPQIPQRNICPITRMPARYFDPVTQMAYANLQAFKVLREAYYQQLEQKGDRKQADVATWIDWRKKFKAQQQQAKQEQLTSQQSMPLNNPTSVTNLPLASVKQAA